MRKYILRWILVFIAIKTAHGQNDGGDGIYNTAEDTEPEITVTPILEQVAQMAQPYIKHIPCPWVMAFLL